MTGPRPGAARPHVDTKAISEALEKFAKAVNRANVLTEIRECADDLSPLYVADVAQLRSLDEEGLEHTRDRQVRAAADALQYVEMIDAILDERAKK